MIEQVVGWLFVYFLIPPVVGTFVGCLSGFYDEWWARTTFDFLADFLYPWRWNWKPRKRRKRQSMKTVTIYTDGACSGNPGPGGWGAILMYGAHKKELSGGEGHTTNNRMELTGVITALEALKEPCIVELYSDSKYVIDALEKGWAKGWQAKGWVKADKKPALNPDLWGRLLELCDYHKVNLHWVKGHAENPYNNRCDELAVAQSKRAAENKLIEASCQTCMRMANGECGGMSKEPCEDYRARYIATKMEQENAPKYGDATAFRIRDYERFNRK